MTIGVKEIAIAYSTILDEAEMLAKQLETLIPREHILITRLGCATSTYVGSGTLAMALIGGKERQTTQTFERSVKLASARIKQPTMRKRKGLSRAAQVWRCTGAKG